MTTAGRQGVGQGLLEAIIGIGVILAGTVGTITLVSSTVRAGRTTNNEIVAASLAREGIEVVRAQRDSNWLKIQANQDTDPGLAGLQLQTYDGVFSEAAPQHFTVPVFTENNNNWGIETIVVPPTTSEFDALCNIGVDQWICAQVFEKSGVFVQRVSPPSPQSNGYAESRFKRMLRLNPICRRDVEPVSSPDGIPDVPADERIASDDGQTCATVGVGFLMVGVQVLSKVQWLEAGGADSVQLEGRLYNWKYAQ